ncbi:vinorine synthase-like [Vigna unguiculata]|uniref:Shikimate O-hydroxycinnamoyltransferase n=1 Tax=Vigna unguiculata TaxID=3917 RepID=A0A4D6MPV4_VIGUN|nr:vinorine synthase-like [Vigna unguiculata]QCE02701.1 shikimate O-hydroxycinnamoyltransferase [Vigna unguiculata]
MKVDVEIISREDIRPSSPTPSHLRLFRLSVLDHLIPSPYVPIILFYTSPKTNTTHLSEVPKRLELLKKSLSETLTKFYPLGGKIKEDLSIECNDEGAYFVLARVKCPLHEFLLQPQMTALHKFLPVGLVSEGSNSGTYVTKIQVNIFECGGIAIGMCVSHKIIDGASLSTFIKGWTERAKGCNQSTQPNFIAPSLFPTNSPWFRDLSMRTWASICKQGKWVTRRFLFRNSAIATLKAQTAGTENSTRLQMVSAMLWKSLMGVSKARFGTQRPSFVTHVVNLRGKMDEALCPEHAMGNIIWLIAAESVDADEMGLVELVGKLRTAISRVDKEFVEELRGDKGRSIMQESFGAIREMGSKSDHFGFTSWCNFGFYEADFGWGKPTWVNGAVSADSVSRSTNTIMLVDTRLGDGIEAWVTLREEDMTLLIADHELLTCATLDPSPLAMSSVA